MANISPFTPRREEKRRKAESTNKSSGSGEVVILEEGMTDPMHPKHQQARKAVERADDAFIGNADQIDKTVSEVREKGLQDNLTVLTSAETEEKAGLAPEMDEEGSLIQEAATQLDDQSGEKSKETFNEKNSPFTPGADL